MAQANSNGRRATEPPTGPASGFGPVAYNQGLESGLIGALFVYGSEILDQVAAIQADDFSTVHGHIWHAAHDLTSRDITPDPDLVIHELGSRLVDYCGGRQAVGAIIFDAIAAVTSKSTVAARAEALCDLARARRIQAVALDLARAAGDGSDLDTLVDRLDELRRPATTRLTLTAASDIRVEHPDWVWTDRIPIGGVTLMPGREGDGKTALVCWLAARISQGQLSGDRRGRPADVLYVGMEDDRHSVTVPRLMAAGADLDRFHFLDADAHGSVTLDTHLDDLRNIASRLDVGLVVFDPLDAHLGPGIDAHKKAEVQSVVGRLAVLTQQLRCGALGVAHLNKGTTTNDLLQRINGSRGFTTSVRSVLALGAHPDQPADRLCLVAKANLVDRTQVPAIRFRIESAQITIDGLEPFHTARVAMLGEELGHDASDLLASPTSDDNTQAREAQEWLTELLADGPVTRSEIDELAAHEDISPKSLRTARERLHIIVDRDDTTKGRPSTWRLPP